MWRIKYAVLALAAVLLCVLPGEKPPFYDFSDTFEVWAGTSSSAAHKVLCRSEYAAIDISSLGGISFETEEEAEDILRALGAEVLFTERAAGVTSYYAFVKDLPFALALNGYNVNLHVAVRQNGSVKVGSPIIFGSY